MSTRVGLVCPACETPSSDAAGVTAAAPPDAADLRPSSDRFGQLSGELARCGSCRHRWVVGTDAAEAAARDRDWSASYVDAVDEVTLDEEGGQRRTAARGLDAIERHLSGRGSLLDVGCWTGSFLAAAVERGWTATGLEPSRWAVDQALARGLDVRQGTIADADPLLGAQNGFDALVVSDVLEHLWDPAGAARTARGLLRPGGVLLVTVPDAGSVIARMLGRRWWSVLPMHVQYFTRASMRTLLQRAGFDVVEEATHPKTFTVKYYGGRVAAFVPPIAPLVDRATRGALGKRLVTPNFRDRLLVAAVA